MAALMPQFCGIEPFGRPCVLGFVVHPLDGCVFSLVSKDKQGRTTVHGCLGIYVNDGIGARDEYFRKVIGKLREIYSFGAYKSSLRATETQMLRQICGSIQHAAAHTRPDLAAKVGELQAATPNGRIEHLSANRVLYEAKTKAVSLMIVKFKNHK